MLARQGHISRGTPGFPPAVAGRRNARPTKFVRIGRAQASVCFPAGCPQTKTLRKLSARRPDRLVERAADIDRLVAIVDARFDGVCLDLGAVFPQRLDIFFGELAARG